MARPDLLADMNNMDIIKRYRFDRDGIDFLVELLNNDLRPRTARRISLTTKEKVLITLRYLGTEEIMLNDADIHSVVQASVSNTIDRVLTVLSSPNIIRRFVRFPTSPAELRQQVQQFAGIAQFPKVIGIIDGTQVRIQAPSHEEEVFVNRKGQHAINVQLACNSEDELVDVVARWPGSTHDSRILHQSGLRQMFEGGVVPPGYHLLGDSGYPCRNLLLTPYLNQQPGAQRRYNRSHKTTRAKVEGAIGQLKRRFGILHSEIRMEPKKACRAIIACVILHNICKRRGIPLPNDGNVGDGNGGDGNGGNGQQNNGHNVPNSIQFNSIVYSIYSGHWPIIQCNVGLRYRDYIAYMYF